MNLPDIIEELEEGEIDEKLIGEILFILKQVNYIESETLH